jgi:hypothetical protein
MPDKERLYLPVNEFQTPVDDELYKHWPVAVVEEMLEVVNAVPYVQRLVAPDRPRARDLPRDEEGKIIVDLCNPHILENMEYFTEVGRYFKEHGRYTELMVNKQRGSEFMKFFERECKRVWEGMVRPEDGEWIPGELYFYLNYMPISQTVMKTTKRGVQYGEKKVDIPEVWEGVYLRFHYMHQARYGGKYNPNGGLHGAEISSRGKSKALWIEQEIWTPMGKTRWQDVQVGDLLFDEKGGTTRVLAIPYEKCTKVREVQTYDGHVITCTDDHLWRARVNGEERLLTLKEIEELAGKGIACSLPPGKGCEWPDKPVRLDPYVFGLALAGSRWDNGLLDVFYEFKGDGPELRKLVPYETRPTSAPNCFRVFPGDRRWSDMMARSALYNLKEEEKRIPRAYIFNSREKRLEMLRGVFDAIGGNGEHGDYVCSIASPRLARQLQFVARSLGYICSVNNERDNYYIVRVFTRDQLFKLPRKIRKRETHSQEYSYDLQKRMDFYTRVMSIGPPRKGYAKCVTVDNPTGEFLVGDFLPTHNSYSLAAMLIRLFSFGVGEDNRSNVKALVVAPDDNTLIKDGVLNKFVDGLAHVEKTTQFPSKTVKANMGEMHWVAGWKEKELTRGSQNEVIGVPLGNNPDKTRGKRSSLMLFDELGKERNFSRWYSISMPNVQEGAIAFGFSFSTGTGGTEGANFEGALDILNSPRANFLYAIPNYYDRGSTGSSETVYFFPAYMNYKPFYNKDGVSDVILSLLYELRQRHTIRFDTHDPLKLTQRRAEFAFTLQDAVMRRDSTIFPVADLVDRINYIDLHPEVRDSLYAGRLQVEKGEVHFVPDSNLKPVWFYPHRDNKLNGCVLIKTMPVKTREGEVASGRYIAGFDPVAVDGAETLSLCACHILDLYTDELVASYVGRETLVDDSFEIVRRLLLFYNALCNYENNKNGFFKYMSQHGCLHMLCDNLEFLQNKDNPRITIGNARKGTPASKPTSEYGRSCLREYLIKPLQVTMQDDEGSEPVTKTIKTLETIPFRSALQEMSMWTLDLNCDEVDSLTMLFLLREDKLRLLGEGTYTETEMLSSSYLGNDPFLVNNYPGNKEDPSMQILKKLGYIAEPERQ